MMMMTFKRQLKTVLFQQPYQQKEHMSAVLRPTFYVVLFCTAFTIFNFYFFVRPICVGRWSMLF